MVEIFLLWHKIGLEISLFSFTEVMSKEQMIYSRVMNHNDGDSDLIRRVT